MYADTSVFVSLYLPDAHSESARRKLAGTRDLWLTPLHRAEFAHAVTQHVFRREITTRQAQQVRRLFEKDRSSRVWIEVGLPDAAFERCVALAQRYGSRLGTRTLDTLHVACALELQAERFWTFDKRQSRLAKIEGLTA